MIDASRLLADCQRLVRHLEEKDLRERLSEHPDLEAQVKAEFERARDKRRTGQSYAVWRDEHLTQGTVHWVLAAVFVRFLEDNGLLPDPWISGPGSRLRQARDRHQGFFARQPAASDREYLLACFREVEALPAMAPLFDERHNPLFQLGPTADGAKAILELFRRTDPGTGELIHDFTDESWNTRFLGDLYQDLSEAARQRYALLQTPEFVEEFLLDRTLEPAMEVVGYQKVRLIDPTCGSGHFLLGAFHRIFGRWRANDAATNDTALARNALDQIAGVDLNPFAVAIASFRLLVAALKVSGIRRLKDAAAFPLNLAAGDSLLHGPRPGDIRGRTSYLFGGDPLSHVYDSENEVELRRILGTRYHVVVGNPPYIRPTDSRLNQAYRERFGSCYRKYPLAVPFTERFFDLAEVGPVAGWVGMITTNSFMKREFGKKLIEKYLRNWDITHVIDTSGAYIPGHGTSTAMLIGRNQLPASSTIRTIMGIRGEPGTPRNPDKGLVWSSIIDLTDAPGSQNDFISVADIERSRFNQHPWSIGGGGAADLKELLDENGTYLLGKRIESAGFGAILGEDDVFAGPRNCPRMRQLPQDWTRPLATGEFIRDWSLESRMIAMFPYDAQINLRPETEIQRWLWFVRSVLAARPDFSKKTYREVGRPYWEYHQIPKDRNRATLLLAFGEVATHNHFMLDRGGHVFNRTAPIIELVSGSTEDDHFRLLGTLNSSTACFWLRQVCFPKGGDHVGTEGARVRKTLWEERFAFNVTNLLAFPLPTEAPLAVTRQLVRLSAELAANQPQAVLERQPPSQVSLAAGRINSQSLNQRMIALQEELDWQVYRLYRLLEEPLEADPSQVPEVALGERPFEIVLARKMAAGEIETKWFERHGSTPITEIPSHWPEPYRQVIAKRIQAIEVNPWIALIEQPEYKRRWNREPWEEQEKRALRDWLLDRLEDRSYWSEPRVTSTARLADRLRQDQEFRQIAMLYRGRDDFDWTDLVTELVSEESVPFLSAYRYTDTGLRKRAEWEETWRLQRLEDAGEKIDPIPIPPRYGQGDFRNPSYWRLRGKLDVPKERFILYPGLEPAADRTPVVGWAGWDHLQQAQALATAYQELREQEGWGADRLTPALAGLQELIPWLRQWHNEPDPAHHGERLGDFFAAFLEEEARTLGLTPEALASWRPEETKRGRKGGRRKKAEEPGLFEE